jgi:hypothetical protein
MAIAIDVHGKGTPLLTTPQTSSITLGVGATQLFVGVVFASVNVTSVTWNGANLQKIGGSGSVGGFKEDLWAMKSPDSGTHDLVVTWDSAPGNGANSFWLSMTGGDTVTGWRTVYTRTTADGTGPGDIVVDSVAGDIVVHTAFVFSGTIVFDGGETAQQSNDMFGGTQSGGLSYISAVGPNTAVGCTDQATYGETSTAAMPDQGTPITGLRPAICL